MTALTSCPECGARLSVGADRCDLCGHVLARPTASAFEENEAVESVSGRIVVTDSGATAQTLPAPTAPGVPVEAGLPRSVKYCGQCGAQNPISGRFCTMCGAPFADMGDVPAHVAPGTSLAGAPPSKSLGRKAWVLVASVALAAVALFVIDRLSGTPEPPVRTEAPTAAATVTPPTPTVAPPTADPEVETRAAAIAAEIESAGTEAARIGKRIELVEVLARAGLYGRAAEAQAALAEVTQTAAAWATVGTLWLDHIPQVGPDEQPPIALQAIDAYQQSLAIDDDPDVRVNLALAYQYDPATPMGTVEQLQQVLGGYPDHPEANFNMGLMRARIGRIDEAIASMERVVAVTDHDNPVHQRAELELAQLRGQAGG
ncbi:MAG: hypothetical protein AAF809_05095 [Bacteroidota bacterium]